MLTVASGIPVRSGRTRSRARVSAVSGSTFGAPGWASAEASAPVVSSLSGPSSPSSPFVSGEGRARVFCEVRVIRRRAVCSPRSPDSSLSRSEPIVVTSVRRKGTSSTSWASIGRMVSSVVGSGVPTGSETSAVNSPWWSSGISSDSRLGTAQASQPKQAAIIA